jgi:ferredoxin-NADP reductase
VAAYALPLRRRESVAEGTVALYFERPAGFVHRAGQNALFTVHLREFDSKGPSRTLSIASAPHEPELMIATRLRETAFKRALASAEPGTTIHIDGPSGAMVLHEDAERPAVFLAGGIGVTPFLSMARDAARRHLPHRVTMFYANRRPEDAAFLDELHELERHNPRFRLVATMSQAEKSTRAWDGETGLIRPELLARYLPDLRSPIYYCAGPHGMTMAMEVMLGDLGIADDDVRSEEFYGY